MKRTYLLTVEEPLYTHLLLEPVLASGVIEVGGVSILHPRVGFRRYLTTLATLGMTRCAFAGLAQFYPSFFKTSVATLLRKHQVSSELIAQVADVNGPAHVTTLKASGCSLMLALNCPQLLTPAVLEQFSGGVLNVHFGMLPRYRGVMPAYHALLAGESSFGVTIHLMDKRIDNGPILAQRAVAILSDDTLPDLYQRGFKVAGRMLVEVFEELAAGSVTAMPNDRCDATYYGQPTVRSLVSYTALAFRRWVASFRIDSRGTR